MFENLHRGCTYIPLVQEVMSSLFPCNCESSCCTQTQAPTEVLLHRLHGRGSRFERIACCMFVLALRISGGEGRWRHNPTVYTILYENVIITVWIPCGLPSYRLTDTCPWTVLGVGVSWVQSIRLAAWDGHMLHSGSPRSLLSESYLFLMFTVSKGPGH